MKSILVQVVIYSSIVLLPALKGETEYTNTEKESVVLDAPDIIEGWYYRLSIDWRDDRCWSLDAKSGYEENVLSFDYPDYVGGQYWKLTQIGNSGHYRLSPFAFEGKKSLQVENDGVNVVRSSSASTQEWILTKKGHRSYSLHNLSLGKEKSLTVGKRIANVPYRALVPYMDTTGQAENQTFFLTPANDLNREDCLIYGCDCSELLRK